MDKLKQSPAELLKLVQIKPIEQECLDRVFSYLGKHSLSENDVSITMSIVEKGRCKSFKLKPRQVTALLFTEFSITSLYRQEKAR